VIHSLNFEAEGCCEVLFVANHDIYRSWPNQRLHLRSEIRVGFFKTPALHIRRG
jgi:hypothetical protein